MNSKRTETVRRVRHEMLQYAGVSAYLYVCFGALLLYKAAILHAQGIAFEFYGVALVKALILGKFVLVLNALKIGGTAERRPLAWHIFVKSVMFMVLLVFLTVVEEAVSALIHGQAAREGVAGIAGGNLVEALATSLLVLLILIPYIAWREIAVGFGERKMLRLLLNPYSAAAEVSSSAPAETHAAGITST